MKIVLSCGHPHSAYQLAHQSLIAAGLTAAQPSRREALLASELHEKIFRAHELDPVGVTATAKLSPGKVWQDMAVDLIAGNLDLQHWGWADARSVWLLDFWKELEPQIRFVLVYTAPESAVGQMLRNQPATPQLVKQAITSWAAYNTELLRFYHRNQDRCLLVNASAVINAPAMLVDRAAKHLGLNLSSADKLIEIGRIELSAVASGLAKALIEDNDDASALYRELESTADINAQDNDAQEAEKRRAWQEYEALLVTLEVTANEAKRSTEDASQLKQDQQKTQQSFDTLKRQLDENSKLAGDRQAQIERLTKEKAEQAKLLAEQQQLKVNHGGDLKQENELLLLQLHQVQEELENYFLKYQELAGKGGAKHTQNSFSCATLPAGVTFDLRQEIEGENWYDAEVDGRWAGPNDVSTIIVPSQGAGRFELELEVADAMEPEILMNMQVALNGTQLEISNDWDSYPAVIAAQFSIENAATQDDWVFQFNFPKLVSPSQHGSEDTRSLAIRLSTLRIRKLG